MSSTPVTTRAVLLHPARRASPVRRRRPNPAIGNTVTLLCRTLVEFPPDTVAAVATVTTGEPVHRIADIHHLDVARVSRLARTCAAVHTITGFDFADWPRAIAGTHADPQALSDLLVNQSSDPAPPDARHRSRAAA